MCLAMHTDLTSSRKELRSVNYAYGWCVLAASDERSYIKNALTVKSKSNKFRLPNHH